MNTKLELTKYIINTLNLKIQNKKDITLLLHNIWKNPRLKKYGGLGLTSVGFDLFLKTDIKYYEIKSEQDNIISDSKFILWLDNHFTSPFYIRKHKIVVFDEHLAVQLVLFSGNIQRYYQAHTKFAEKQNTD